MKTLILILLLLTSSSLFSQNKWEEITKLEGYFSKMVCIDSNTCFITMSINKRNWLYKTTNQGKEWKMLKGESDFNDAIWAKYLSVPDSQNIYIGFTYGEIYGSNDGGLTFKMLIGPSTYGIIDMAMLNQDVGLISKTKQLLITEDGWETSKDFDNPIDSIAETFTKIQFLNDSIAIGIFHGITSKINSDLYLFKINMHTFEAEYYYIDFFQQGYIQDICIVSENQYYLCGYKNVAGKSNCIDAVYKTIDGGKTWRNILDLDNRYKLSNLVNKPTHNGIRGISFKDSLVGILIGNGNKVAYTYDGGESWIYEANLIDSLINGLSPSFQVRYAGSVPIICDYYGRVLHLYEDNLAPKMTDTVSICGRVMHEGKGQRLISVSIGNRVTMTDSNGYYKFTQLPVGSYSVRAINKYYSGPDSLRYYCPYIYSPDTHEITVTDDTCGLDFTAIDNIQYRTIGGRFINYGGKPYSGVTVHLDTIVSTTTDSSGYYSFPGLEWHKTYKIIPENKKYLYDPETKDIKLVCDSLHINFFVHEVTGVTESEASAILKYDGAVLYVSPDYCLPDYVIIVSDLSGRELLKVPARAELSLASLPRGLYLISISNGSKVLETVKIITN